MIEAVEKQAKHVPKEKEKKSVPQQTMNFEKEKSVKKPKVPGRKRGRPKKVTSREVSENTGGGLPFFNPYGGKAKKSYK